MGRSSDETNVTGAMVMGQGRNGDAIRNISARSGDEDGNDGAADGGAAINVRAAAGKNDGVINISISDDRTNRSRKTSDDGDSGTKSSRGGAE